MQHMSSPVRFRNSKKDATFSEKQLSSLSIEDQEDIQFPFAMKDLPPVSHSAGQLHMADHQMAEEPSSERFSGFPMNPPLPRPIPCLPCSPKIPPRAKNAGLNSQIPPLPMRSPVVSQVSVDSPLSPASRPRSPWGSFDPYDSPEDQDKEYVGFATLPNQVHRKTVKKGFTFTLMVAGESGLGKSTLINSLFLTDLYKDRKVPNAEERISQTIDIIKHTVSIEEKGIKLKLSIIDTPGFGDAINNTESWRYVEDYIDQQFEQYFRDESGLNRKNIQDNRVHCLLYFVSPFGHSLRPLDVECMRALHEKVNIVPLLAKADSLTHSELLRKKMKHGAKLNELLPVMLEFIPIREEIKDFGINIYQFPECDSDEDEDLKTQEEILQGSIPFAVIGSNIQMESKGRKFRGRSYPWGVVEVENPAHSDFLLLRNMLVRTHMQDLKDVTRELHYENYRAQCIQNMTLMMVQEKKRSLHERFQAGREADFPLPLAAVGTEKERQILEKDEELRRMQEVLDRIQEQMQHSQRGGC